MRDTPIQHSSNAEARHQFVEDFEQASVDEQWMAAVWKIKDGKIFCEHITTHKFPKGDMVAAVGHLAIKLHNSVFLPQEPEPLPTVFPDQWSPSLEKKNGEDELDQGVWKNEKEN